MTLPQELIDRCRAILLKCSEFDKHDSLQAIFVTSELRIFQDGLPECRTKKERVSQTFAYLLPQRLSNNKPVLPLFLARLIERLIDQQMETAFTRFEDEFDHLCEIGVGDLRAIKRWLFAILPETAVNIQEQKSNPGRRQQMRQMRNKEPRPINRAFFR